MRALNRASDAHSSFGDFDDRDGFDSGAGSGPDVRSGLSGLPSRVRPGGQLLRLPLHLAASVQRIGIWPRRPVRHQSIFCERASARSAESPRLLKLISEQPSSTPTARKAQISAKVATPRQAGKPAFMRWPAPALATRSLAGSEKPRSLLMLMAVRRRRR